MHSLPCAVAPFVVPSFLERFLVLAGELAKTLRILRLGAQRGGQSPLVEALDVPIPEIQTEAAEQLLLAPSRNAHLAVLKRLGTLPAEVLEIVRNHRDELAPAFRQGLQYCVGEELKQVLVAISTSKVVAHLDLVLPIVVNVESTQRETAIDVVHELTRALRIGNYQPTVRRGETSGEVVARDRSRSLEQLKQFAEKASDSLARRAIAEAIIAIGTVDDKVVHWLLWQSPQSLREETYQVLAESSVPSVMALICSTLELAYPHPKLFQLITMRTDPEFIAYLVRYCLARMSGTVQRNVKQIRQLGWLDPDNPYMELLPTGMHPDVIRFVDTTSVLREQKELLRLWMLRHGSVEARQLAIEHTSAANEVLVQDLLVESLHSSNPEIQVWGVHKLIEHGVPNAIRYLISMLEAEQPVIVAAAKEELAKVFHIGRLVSLIDEFPIDMAVRAGIVCRLVDEGAVPTLREALRAAQRQKRVAAIKAVSRLGFVDDLLAELKDTFEEADHSMRRQIIDALRQAGTDNSLELLAALTPQAVRPTATPAAFASSSRYRWDGSPTGFDIDALIVDPGIEKFREGVSNEGVKPAGLSGWSSRP